MHANETKTDAALVRRLLAAQFPAWADLPVEPVRSSGTVNAIYRLGTDLTVRLPRVEGGSRDVATEHRWLPHLAPHLPHAIPAPLAQGVPGEGYPWSWSVCRWLDGTNPPAGAGSAELACDIAEFVLALRHVDTTDGPPAFRSEPLAARDTATRGTLNALHGVIDTGAAADAWSAALRAPAPEGPPVWVHGDLQPGNVLVTDDGRLSAVIDFGCMGLADPAVDLIPAWYLLRADARPTFRTRVGADPATWERARGWALSIALMELSYYRTSNPVMAGTARRVIGEVVGERG
ncbi:aminoglycoside phosphotransferase family protein [Streptomyces sp. NPDC048511]|uniref:aminoglycoside phosphotransferase family protein n=1 Tax=Streptomyces sp. NPDC048511 TaxID=3365562 RepID=UPI00371EDE07